MEVINFDENELRNQSFKRNVNHLYTIFFDENNASQIITIAEFYEANAEILKSYNNSLRDKVELVPLIYKSCMHPTDEEYLEFRGMYFKQIILSYLFSQNLPLNSYRINKENKKLLKPISNSGFDQMNESKIKFNGIIILKEELIKYLFQNYLNEIKSLVKPLNSDQPMYFTKIKEITYHNIQPRNIALFMDIIVGNYKRIMELYKVYNSDDIKRKKAIEELLKERENLIKQLKNVDDKIGESSTKGKQKVLSSGKQSAKLFMYDDEQGFIQNLLFTFLVGLTSGLSFFCISSLIKFILNRI